MKNTEKILKILSNEYENVDDFLKYDSPFELVVAVMLSAQCTDKRVNEVTKVMFKKYNTPQDFANLDIEKIEQMIKPCGFYHAKAKHIKECSTQIINNFDGKVPQTMKELMSLSGIGRKSANVIMNDVFKDTQGIAVDTHVFRLSKRLGLSDKNEPTKVEEDLLKIIPKQYWNVANHVLISHGRRICTAQSPKCEECIVKKYCRYYLNK